MCLPRAWMFTNQASRLPQTLLTLLLLAASVRCGGESSGNTDNDVGGKGGTPSGSGGATSSAGPTSGGSTSSGSTTGASTSGGATGGGMAAGGAGAGTPGGCVSDGDPFDSTAIRDRVTYLAS